MNNNKYLFIVVLTLTLLSIFNLLRKESRFSLSSSIAEVEHLESGQQQTSEARADVAIVNEKTEASSPEVAPTSSDSFGETLKELYRDLPRKGELSAKNQAEVLHGTPSSVFEAATKLGSIKQLFIDKSALKPQALLFYRLCAKNSEIMTSIRAVCWQDALELYRELGRDPHAEEISPEVRKLSSQL